MSQVYYVLTRIRGYRPAAVLLHTAETDAVLIDTAGDLGVACLQLPAPAVLRQSVRSVWDLVSTVKVFLVTKEAIKALRLAPTFCRRMSTEGVLCQVDTEQLASLIEKHCPRVKSAYADSWHVSYSTASPGQDTP